MEGTSFGHYRLMTLIGRGGMGEVWRAYDNDSDRVVALKVLPAHLAENESFQQRFRREARTAANLTEPHVIPIHRYGEIDGRLYVDMRLIEGKDLQDHLEQGPLSPTRAVMIVEQVASALNAAHRVGLVHRDIKPSNILIAENDFAYLIDFGIARSTTDAGVTSTGQVVGTWAYMAPERFSSRDVDARSDVYALACVLHECLTGRRPFPGNSLEEQVGAHLTAPPPRPSLSNRGVSTRFDDVIAKGMAKDLRTRYQTSLELAKAARAAVTAPPPRVMPEPPTTPQPTALPPLPTPPWTPPPREYDLSHSAVTRMRPDSGPVQRPETPATPPPVTRPQPRRSMAATYLYSFLAITLAAGIFLVVYALTVR